MIFEMKKKKGVWVHENRYSYRNDSNTAPGIGDWSTTMFVEFDEPGLVDFDRTVATLCGRKFSGRTEAARAKGVPTNPDVRRTSFLRDVVDEQREHIRSKLEEHLRRML